MSEERIKDIQNKMVELVDKRFPQYYNILVPEKLGKKMVGLNSIREDILFCQYVLEEIIERKKQKNQNAIFDWCSWYSTIVVYGRCFTKTAHHSKSKLEVKDCFKNSDTDLFKLHDELINLRHTFLAHRGESHAEQGLLFFQMPKVRKSHTAQFHVESVHAERPTDFAPEEYVKLFAHIKTIVEEMMKKYSYRLETRMIENAEKFKQKFKTVYEQVN